MIGSLSEALYVQGMDEMKRQIAKAAVEMNRRELAFKKSVAVIDRWIQDNFRTQGGKVGGWAPLSAATYYGGIKGQRVTKKGISAAMRRHILKKKILQDTGTLRMKWKHTWDNDHGAVVSAVEYGHWHDDGTDKMPQRRILPTEEEAWTLVKPLFSKHIADALMRAEKP